MTNLYVLLIAIGVFIIAGVFAYNWWQERKYYQQAEKNFTPLQSDALLDNPSLNVNAVKEAFEDTIIDEFSPKNAKNAAFKPEAQFSISATTTAVSDEPKITEPDLPSEALLPDNVSINEAYAQLAKARVVANQQTASTKPVRREDIKAIFDDAFGHKNKVESAQSTTSSISTASTRIEAVAPVQAPKQATTPVPSTVELSAATINSAQSKTELQPLALAKMLDKKMDCSVLLHLSRELPASTIVNALSGRFDGFDKPIFVHTLTANALDLSQDVSALWSMLKEVSPHQKVSKLCCSLQLADRSGAVSRNLFNRFQVAINELTKMLNATADWQDTEDVLAKANALDAFCINVDKTIGFHLVHGEQGPFTGTKLKGLAESSGFRLASDGSFKFYDDHGHIAFIMFNRENFRFNVEMLRNSVIKGITFQLDIPHVAEGAHIFNLMVQVARQMEIGLNGTLVDEGNKVLLDEQLDKIRQQLNAIHNTMKNEGIVPGSTSAIRLFS